MKIWTMLPVVLLLVTPAVADDAADAGAALHNYFETFNQKDVQKVANEVYSTPVHIGGGEGHRVLANPDAAVDNLTNLYEQIEAQGWVESRISDLEVCIASATLALVDTQYSRLDKNGGAIAPPVRTTLYVLQKIAGEWRIVAFYGHDDDKRPNCK